MVYIFELTYARSLQTNVLATNYLALLLLPLLKRTAEREGITLPPHLTIVGSNVHFSAKFIERNSDKVIAALNDETRFDGGDRYNTTKLLNIYSGRELAHLGGNNVVVNVVKFGLLS